MPLDEEKKVRLARGLETSADVFKRGVWEVSGESKSST